MPARRDSPCLYCGKLLTKKSVYEHERHHCKKNKHRVKRSFSKKQCAVCGKYFHGAGLRAHYATAHPLDFARDKAQRKNSSKAAQRRELVADQRFLSGSQTQNDSAKKTPAKATSRPSDPGSRPHANRAWAEIDQKMSKAATT